MSKARSQPVVEINGKRYGAVSGEVYPADKVTHRPASSAGNGGRNLDGFFRQQAKRHAHHVTAHKMQKATTLMRHVVQPPRAKPHIGSQVTALTAPESPPLAGTAAALAAAPSRRLHRAQSVRKSSHISKFGVSVNSALTKKMTPLGIKQPPAASRAITTKQPTTAEQFAAALASATSHERPPLKKHKLSRRLGRRTKLTSLLAGSLATLLLVGFVAYQNVPNFAMRIAASRAGFAASLPGYKPAGFALKNPIQYGPGHISLTFRSSSDDRAFTLVQRPTSWNSEALLDNFIASNHQSYLTYQDKGKTIYIYNGANATWVNGGVWYQVESNDSLSSDQLLKIANSL